MKKKLSFKRQILENIDNFKYLDPDSLCKDDEDEDKNKKEDDEKDNDEATDKEFERVKRYSRPIDIRRYLQYVNAKSD